MLLFSFLFVCVRLTAQRQNRLCSCSENVFVFIYDFWRLCQCQFDSDLRWNYSEYKDELYNDLSHHYFLCLKSLFCKCKTLMRNPITCMLSSKNLAGNLEFL